MDKKNILFFFLILLVAPVLLFFSIRELYQSFLGTADGIFNTQTPSNEYNPKKYDLETKLIGLSQEQIDQHKTLYDGYVKKRNEITKNLKIANRNERNRTYTPYRELKVEETYAVNGQLLHELYFENLGAPGIQVGAQMKQLIEQQFGSLEAFKEDFMAAAGCSRGWVVTVYGLDDGKIHNYVLEAHNQNVPVLIIPLLVLDVYEHAYMIDYGIKRDPYLDLFWDHIDWNVVEQRIDKWVNKLR